MNIRLSSYDGKILDETVSRIVAALRPFGVKIRPSHLEPTEGPKQKRIIRLPNPNARIINALAGVDVPKSVRVSIA